MTYMPVAKSAAGVMVGMAAAANIKGCKVAAGRGG